MKQKNGFTLIELLAVIVILAVIALIATPMILGVIDSAKKGAAESSAYGYLEAVENSTLADMIENQGLSLIDGTYTISSDGSTIQTGTAPNQVVIKVSFKGDSPKGADDNIVVAGGKITSAKLTINGFVVTYDGSKATAA